MALLKDHLIAHYKMNDNAATPDVIDSSGSGHTGEYQLNNIAQNTNTSDETGKTLRALDFVGGANGEHIEIADHADFSPGAGIPGSGTPFSISAWVYNHGGGFFIASKGVYNTDGEWEFYVAGNVLYFRMFDNSVASCYIGQKGASTIPTNQWVHLIGTHDGGKLSSGIRLYVNAVCDVGVAYEAAAPSFVAVENLGHNVWVGRYSTFYANGLIDNTMFFNKELTLNNVKALYNSGRGTEILPIGIQLSRTGQRFSSFPEN